MRELNRPEMHVLNCIVRHEPVTKTTLIRYVGHGVKGPERDEAITELLELGLIKSFQRPFRLGKPGKPPRVFESTQGGRNHLEEYIEQQNSLGVG